MATPQKPFHTPEQYLALEREADHRSEYLSGEIFAMAGATEAHVTITVNISGELRAQLHGKPCRTYAMDMRVRVSPTGLYTYPDVIAVCGERRFGDVQRDTLTNPTIVVEVLSASTERYDRGEKFRHYQTLDSLTDYILVAQDRVRVEHYVRQGDNQWLLTVAEQFLDRVLLSSVQCELLLAAVYENIDFEAAPMLQS